MPIDSPPVVGSEPLSETVKDLTRNLSELRELIYSQSKELSAMAAQLARQAAQSAHHEVQLLDQQTQLTSHSAQLTDLTSHVRDLALDVDAHQVELDTLGAYTRAGFDEHADLMSSAKTEIEEHARVLEMHGQRLLDCANVLSELKSAMPAPSDPPGGPNLIAGVQQRFDSLETGMKRPAAVYLGRGRLLVTTDRGQMLICQGEDIQLTPELVRDRIWDPPLTRFYERNLRLGMTYLDVGANIGYFTTLATSLVGHTGRVHAFEPFPPAFELLELNARLNHQSYLCELNRLALAETPGEKILRTFQHNFGSSTLSALPEKLLAEFNERPSEITIAATTLDAFYGNRDVIFDFIKIDAEGAEPLIFEGGAEFFERHIHTNSLVSIEYNPPAITGLGREPRRFLARLLDLRFKIWRLEASGPMSEIHSPSDLDEWNMSELILSRGATPH